VKPYYAEGGITIYHGDARDVLADVSSQVDLLLTDPPYGLAFSGKGVASGLANISADGVRQGMRVVRQVLFEASGCLTPDAHLLMFCGWQSWPDFYDAVSSYIKIRNALIWHKASGGQGSVRTDYIRDYEVILFGSSGLREIGGVGSYSNVLTGYDRPPQTGRLHPTQKPLGLIQHLIGRHASPQGVVLDPFLGSGTTLLAAKNSGRQAIGIEIEERYCEIAANRLAQEVLNLEAA
jgi:site-specific DNA-methyltransferase (adenine-specific)